MGDMIDLSNATFRDSDGNAIIPMEALMPHLINECMCVKCLHRWIDVRPEGTLLKTLVCPGCGDTGYVINTGEYIPDEGEDD